MASSDVEFDSDLEEQARSLTTCSICMDQFKCPKVLPCQHTFCLVCLKQCYESINSQRLVSVSNFPCPACRKICYVPQAGLEQLATDFRIGQILDLMAAIDSSIQSQQRSKNKTMGFGQCSICRFQKRERPAGSFCLQCEKAFCDQCLSHHAKTKIFQDHLIINDSQTNGSDEPRQDPEKCFEHGATFKYFCEDCSVLLCTICLFSEHNNHSVIEKEKVVDDLDKKFNIFAEEISNKCCKLNQVKEKLKNLKQLLATNKGNVEADVCSAYDESLRTIENLKDQLLSNMRMTYENSVKDLEDVWKNVEDQQTVFQQSYDTIMAAKMQKGTVQFFNDFKNIKDVLPCLPLVEFKPLILETSKFMASIDISMGSIDKTKKTVDLDRNDIEQVEDVSSQPQKMELPNKEICEKPKKIQPPSSQIKAIKVTKLHLSTQNGGVEKFNNKKDFLKPSSSDKLIQGLGRRLSGRLSIAAMQQMNQAGAITTSPSKKKINWIAEGFSQCRDCCFLKISNQWMIAACDYKATNAGDRIKIFDLKGRQQGVISLRAIVEPWGLVYQKSSHSFVVTDHASRAVKLIRLDEAGRCSKVMTMSQSYLDKPTGITLTRSGEYVITDVGTRKHRLAVYFPTSTYIERRMGFGLKGNGDGEVVMSNYVVVDNEDRVIVPDIEAHNVKIFSLEDGRQILKFSCSCSFDGGKEMEPQGVAIDDSNNILIADQATKNIVMFSSEGQLIGNIASCKGQPWGIAYMDEFKILAVATDRGLEVFEL